jgi:hypothetical protein
MVVVEPPEHDTLHIRPDGQATPPSPFAATHLPLKSQLSPLPHDVPPGTQSAAHVDALLQ